MIELVFVVCLIAAPTTCERHAMQFTDVTVRACMAGAQPRLARWVVAHPDWQIQRWTCHEAEMQRDA